MKWFIMYVKFIERDGNMLTDKQLQAHIGNIYDAFCAIRKHCIELENSKASLYDDGALRLMNAIKDGLDDALSTYEKGQSC